MRIQLALVALVTAATTSFAQVQDGPLAPPTAPATASAPAKAKPAKKPHKKAVATKAKDPASDSHQAKEDEAPASVPTSRAAHHGTAAADPVSLGLKWNGSNDTAERTRVQNYNGDASGAGAALGLNFHF